jgi:polar amino acid transport system substrate-binding protein
MTSNRRSVLKGFGLAAGLAGAASLASACQIALPGQPATATQAPAAAGTTASTWSFGNGINRIRDNKKLVVGTSLAIPPQAYRDQTTREPKGYDIEIAKKIATDLEVELSIEETVGVAPRIAGLLSGKYDLVLSGTANRPSRALAMYFTRGYVPYEQVMLINDRTTAKTLDDLNDPKYTITATTGSTGAARAVELFPKATQKELLIQESMLEVAAYRADACLVEKYAAGVFARSNPNTKIMGGLDNSAIAALEWGAIPVRADDIAFGMWLDNWIYWNDTHGQIKTLYDTIMMPAIRGEAIT